MKFYIIAIAVVLLALGILKLLNMLFTQKLKKHLFNEQERNQKDLALFVDAVSYKKYKNIARRTSVRNSPHRKVGNFLDFLLANICEESSAIENTLAYIDCGEIYE